MGNLSSAFNQNLGSNPDVMHVTQCLPEPSPSTSFDNLYFGITTANRDTGVVGGANLNLRNLSTARQNAN